jgi:hypothetical protein
VLFAVFLGGLMVGRTPEYLGKKIEAREMKLAVLALFLHPVLIVGPVGLFTALGWGPRSVGSPAAHGFAEVVYEFSSAASNNGSEFAGLRQTWGFNDADEDSPPRRTARTGTSPPGSSCPWTGSRRSWPPWPWRGAWRPRRRPPRRSGPCEPTP